MSDTDRTIRRPLDRERVLRTAISVADREGIEAVTMRRIGRALGVEAMALYRYVEGKDDVLDGMIDILFGDVELPQPASDWRAAIRGGATAAREITRPHRWAPRLVTSRRVVAPSMLRYIDWATGVFRDAGFTPDLSHHAMHVLGARLMGFVQEPFNEGELTPELARDFVARIRAGDYPAIANALGGAHHDDDAEFAFGLDLILDGLERARTPGTELGR